MKTPIGRLCINSSEKGITLVVFTDVMAHKIHPHPLIDACKQQLKEYFSGKRLQFDLPLDTKGTHFQQAVWQSLSNIPYGKRVSYRDIAESINNPKAVRAVGAANGKNPIGIIVPCHRVIGSNGSLTGYAWGLERKIWLLEHEANMLKPPS
jgi:methylated-DNA-[protein]-cysteine S-methyltransferase